MQDIYVKKRKSMFRVLLLQSKSGAFLASLLKVSNFILGFAASLLIPNKYLITSVFAAICLDFLSGVMAASKGGLDKVTSKRLWDTPKKMLISLSVIMLLQLVHVSFFEGALPFIDEIPTLNKFSLTGVFAAIVIIAELRSIDENWAKIAGYSFFDSINKRLGNWESLVKYKKAEQPDEEDEFYKNH